MDGGLRFRAADRRVNILEMNGDSYRLARSRGRNGTAITTDLAVTRPVRARLVCARFVHAERRPNDTRPNGGLGRRGRRVWRIRAGSDGEDARAERVCVAVHVIK